MDAGSFWLVYHLQLEHHIHLNSTCYIHTHTHSGKYICSRTILVFQRTEVGHTRCSVYKSPKQNTERKATMNEQNEQNEHNIHISMYNIQNIYTSILLANTRLTCAIGSMNSLCTNDLTHEKIKRREIIHKFTWWISGSGSGGGGLVVVVMVVLCAWPCLYSIPYYTNRTWQWTHIKPTHSQKNRNHESNTNESIYIYYTFIENKVYVQK